MLYVISDESYQIVAILSPNLKLYLWLCLRNEILNVFFSLKFIEMKLNEIYTMGS